MTINGNTAALVVLVKHTPMDVKFADSESVTIKGCPTRRVESAHGNVSLRLCVDGMDLCYSKPHISSFVILSGDSDFSPLVSKLRENAKRVIGLGVKNSSSDLLIENCDEFIYYDDLVREKKRAVPKKAPAARTTRAWAMPSRACSTW